MQFFGKSQCNFVAESSSSSARSGPVATSSSYMQQSQAGASNEEAPAGLCKHSTTYN